MKAWTIIWKDTLIRFRDRTGLISYLVAPLILSAIIGAAFGGFSGGDSVSPITDIPLIVVNNDEGELGASFVETLTTSPGLDQLLEPTQMADLNEALPIVEDGDTRAVVYIPPSFSDAIRPPDTSEVSTESAVVQLYPNREATFTPFIIRGIVSQIAAHFSERAISARVTVSQLVEDPGNRAALGPALANLEPAITGEIEALQANGGVQIDLNRVSVGEGGEEEDFNALAFFAPSMAILFVMFSVIDSSRSILDEQLAGTLDRLIGTPIRSSEIILGKIGSTFLTGFLQMVILIVASALLFGLRWGNSPVGLLLITVATVAAATSLGTFIAGFATQPTQVQVIGTAVVLVFTIIGGLFPAQNFPPWLQTVSRFTINRWALDGYTRLTEGGSLTDILPEIGVLIGATLILFTLGVWQFQRRMAR